MWWRDAVVYQVYPRSFQDSDGDGVGDLRGIEQRLDHLSWLGVDALWLSPIYPSPLADMGYDISDHTAVDPAYGTLADLDRLCAAAHARGLRLLLDIVPCHTSIEHPWFRDHPERYIWSDRNGPQNNWIATFGGSAWSPDPFGRGWYLHSFYPEQPDLDWRNPGVAAAIGDVLHFWRARGVDGFRLDALDRIVKDARMRDDPSSSRPAALPLAGPFGTLDHVHSLAAGDDPDLGAALGGLRHAAGDSLLVGEVYQPSELLAPYLAEVDLAFVFDLFHAGWDAQRVRAAVEGGARLGAGAAWVLSNHDFPRLATRLGAARLRAAAVLLLTLPGTAFVYQGEEIGMRDGPGARPPIDRAGRDGARHPMQWEPGAHGGFSEGSPWLASVDAERCNVADERAAEGSLLNLYRDLIALRRRFGSGFDVIDAGPGVVAYRRGEHVVAVNFTAGERPAPAHSEIVLATHRARTGILPPDSALVARASE